MDNIAEKQIIIIECVFRWINECTHDQDICFTNLALVKEVHQKQTYSFTIQKQFNHIIGTNTVARYDILSILITCITEKHK